MSRHLALLCSFTVALLASTGCAGSGSQAPGSFGSRGPSLIIDVENHNAWDMEVEIDAEGGQRRLGIAPSYGRARFLVSDGWLGGASYFRLVGNPMGTAREPFVTVTGQGAITTRIVDLAARRHVSWTVGINESTTNLIIR